jgi:hypothetical protein
MRAKIGLWALSELANTYPAAKEEPGYTSVRLHHRLKVAKATQVISLIRVTVEVAVREQTFDHLERFHLPGPTAKAPVRTPRRVESLGERVAHEFRVGHQTHRQHGPHEREIASRDRVEKVLGLRHPVPLFRQP